MLRRRFTACLFAAFIILANAALPARAVTPKASEIKSETAVLIDGNTGQVLFDKDMHRRMKPASITKVMTALLALENGDLKDTITMTRDAVFSIGRGTSHIALDADEQLSLEQALHALAIVSANDAANGIAEHIGGTLQDFASLMNERAKEAGALDTNFENAHGLPDDKHYTTAYDMAKITAAALHEPEFSKIFTTGRYDMPPTNKNQEPRTFWCKNAMVTGENKYDGIIAGKTGWTTDSQHTLVAAAERDGRRLIAVVIKSSKPNDKWEDAAALLDYGFDEFISVDFSEDELIERAAAPSDGGGGITAEMSANGGITLLIPKDMTKDDVEISYSEKAGGEGTPSLVKAVFSLKGAGPSDIFSELCELTFQVKLSGGPDEAVPAVTLAESADSVRGTALMIDWSGLCALLIRLAPAAGVCLGVYIILLVIRRISKRRRRRRRGR